MSVIIILYAPNKIVGLNKLRGSIIPHNEAVALCKGIDNHAYFSVAFPTSVKSHLNDLGIKESQGEWYMEEVTGDVGYRPIDLLRRLKLMEGGSQLLSVPVNLFLNTEYDISFFGYDTVNNHFIDLGTILNK